MTRRRRPTEMFGKLLLALSLLFKVASSSSVVPEAPSGEPLIFALVPKQANNSFFDLSRDGCQARAALIGNIECLYVGPRDEGDAQAQADIIDDLIARGDIDGISISVTDAAVASEAIARAMNADIPVVTFDSDAAQSERVAYVGTNNPAFGMELGKLLVQLKPLGGTFGIISSGAPNAMEKAQGARDRLQHTEWKQAQESPKDCQGSIDLFYQQMWEYAADPDIRAIIPTGAWPFLDSNTTRWKKFRDANPNITMVVSETLPITLQLMNEGYVDGIVGQLPYNMGELSVDTLLRIYEGEDVQEKIYGTSFMEVLLFPLELPPLVVDMNYLGYLVILGYFMFGLIVICSIAFATWTFINKDTRVVRASQPMFLGMICCGTLIMAASIIPLTVDDQRYSERGADIACMSVPWLIVRKLLLVIYHWMNHILSHTVHCTVFLLVHWLYHDIFGSIQQDLACE
jgi:ABC-type sugar transport system substrate-binding protein